MFWKSTELKSSKPTKISQSKRKITYYLLFRMLCFYNSERTKNSFVKNALVCLDVMLKIRREKIYDVKGITQDV